MIKYVLFNVKMSGFLSDSSTYTSEWRDAKVVDQDTAIQYARRSFLTDGFGEEHFGLIPVNFDDMRKVVGE